MASTTNPLGGTAQWAEHLRSRLHELPDPLDFGARRRPDRLSGAVHRVLLALPSAASGPREAIAAVAFVAARLTAQHDFVIGCLEGPDVGRPIEVSIDRETTWATLNTVVADRLAANEPAELLALTAELGLTLRSDRNPFTTLAVRWDEQSDASQLPPADVTVVWNAEQPGVAEAELLADLFDEADAVRFGAQANAALRALGAAPELPLLQLDVVGAEDLARIDRLQEPPGRRATRIWVTGSQPPAPTIPIGSP
ncbi:MAG: hypothetical protein R2715_20820 [Ilumatobacteraceae bacterium]